MIISLFNRQQFKAAKPWLVQTYIIYQLTRHQNVGYLFSLTRGNKTVAHEKWKVISRWQSLKGDYPRISYKVRGRGKEEEGDDDDEEHDEVKEEEEGRIRRRRR